MEKIVRLALPLLLLCACARNPSAAPPGQIVAAGDAAVRKQGDICGQERPADDKNSRCIERSGC